jgi:Domain of unknown function (DUF5666)
MTMNRSKSLAALALTVLFLAACGTSGGLGDILGGGGSNQQELRGTVQSVDTSSRSIFLTNVVGGDRSMLSNSGSGSVRVYYDANTTVSFNNQTYRPEDLESGDEVAVMASADGNVLTADSMTVLRDSSSGTTSGNYPSYGTTIRGTVAYVDSSRRTIEVDPFNSGSNVIVEFETNTPVYFNNQTYRVGDLERGDEIEIRYRDLGSNRVMAQDITVTRNVSSGSGGTYGGGTSSQMSTVRGTVRYIDTARRTIEIESASWISGFQSGAGTANRYTISYDTNARIDVNGTLEPLSGLEAGDVIEVQVGNTSGSMLHANRLWLVRDVRR